MIVADERPALDLTDGPRKLAHAIARDQHDLATRLFAGMAAASPLALEEAEFILRTRMVKVNRLQELYDLFIAGHPGALSRLRLVAKVCEMAVKLGKPEEAHALIARVLEGDAVRFGGNDSLGASLSLALGPEFRKPLTSLKYKGLAPASMRDIFSQAELLADRIDIDPALVELLFAARSDRSMSREAWERGLRIAFSIGHIVNDRPFTFSGGSDGNNYSSLVDQDALRRDFDAIDKSDGLLVVSWHAGLRPPMFDLFKTIFPDGLVVQRPAGDPAKVICIEPDPGAAMIAVVRAMMDGKTVLMYPDGKHGNRPHAVQIAGKTVMAAGGAALIAYESHCATAWYTILPDGDRFGHRLAVGPKPARREKFEDFAARWLAFYWGEVSAVLTGPPSSMYLGSSWAVLSMWDL